jgi:hypothetical protein
MDTVEVDARRKSQGQTPKMSAPIPATPEAKVWFIREATVTAIPTPAATVRVLRNFNFAPISRAPRVLVASGVELP